MSLFLYLQRATAKHLKEVIFFLRDLCELPKEVTRITVLYTDEEISLACGLVTLRWAISEHLPKQAGTCVAHCYLVGPKHVKEQQCQQA